MIPTVNAVCPRCGHVVFVGSQWCGHCERKKRGFTIDPPKLNRPARSRGELIEAGDCVACQMAKVAFSSIFCKECLRKMGAIDIQAMRHR